MQTSTYYLSTDARAMDPNATDTDAPRNMIIVRFSIQQIMLVSLHLQILALYQCLMRDQDLR